MGRRRRALARRRDADHGRSGRGRRAAESAVDRGQTNLDFLVGIGVFIATVAFVTAFTTSLLSPFVADQSKPVVADRVADDLLGEELAGGDPSELDLACTRAFFGGPDAACPFDQSNALAERLDVADHTLNVTVESNAPGASARQVLCADADGLTNCSGGGTRLAAGATPPGSGTVVTATRVAHVDGRTVAVVVRVW